MSAEPTRVADRQDLGALLLGQLDRGQRIGRLARLADGDDEVFGGRIVAVAELGDAVSALGRNAGELLDPVFGRRGKRDRPCRRRACARAWLTFEPPASCRSRVRARPLSGKTPAHRVLAGVGCS